MLDDRTWQRYPWRILAASVVVSLVIGWSTSARLHHVEEASLTVPSAMASTPMLTTSATVTIEKPKDPYEASPLHGFLPPMFTALHMPICPTLHGEFCPYMSCAASAPETQSSGKLWNAYVVPGKDGPIVICEWRESYLQLR